MFFIKMGFKSILIHQESVMASYAMSVQTGCVVDIGATKISVCCVDDGMILPRTVVRKHYGSNDINEILYRLLKSERALHHFPKRLLYPLDYPYHQMLLEKVKE
jgi:actin-related protein 8